MMLVNYMICIILYYLTVTPDNRLDCNVKTCIFCKADVLWKALYRYSKCEWMHELELLFMTSGKKKKKNWWKHKRVLMCINC